jgi:transposase
VTRLIFIDEFGLHLALSRPYARAPRGIRAEVVEPYRSGSNYSVLSALGLRGVLASLVIEGAVDSAVFECYVRHCLVPELRPGDIVIMDNVSFHYSARAVAAIEAVGARVEYLPAYSPDFNPIEECISKLKTFLRGVKAYTSRKLRNALARAIDLVSPADIQGWFRHCGYTYSVN